MLIHFYQPIQKREIVYVCVRESESKRVSENERERETLIQLVLPIDDGHFILVRLK